MRFKEFLAEQAQTITAILHPYDSSNVSDEDTLTFSQKRAQK